MNDKDPDYSGRGYGGVTVIVKNNPNFSVKEINIASDRIIAVGMYDKYDNLVQIICSSYLHYYDGGKVQLAQYIETIDALQSLVDLYAGLATFKILGDFNTQLPIFKKLNKHWYREKGFTIYSSILYDFLSHNNLTSADLHFTQNPRYTFFCHTSKKYTWIDHILCSKTDMSSVKTCSIIPEESENVSDHLPVRIEFSLLLERNNQQPPNNDQTSQPRWNNTLRNEKYLQLTSIKLSEIGKLAIPSSDPHEIKAAINKRFDAINKILKDAASEAGCVPKKSLKPKTYWCPELSSLRDKKQMW